MKVNIVFFLLQLHMSAIGLVEHNRHFHQWLKRAMHGVIGKFVKVGKKIHAYSF